MVFKIIRVGSIPAILDIISNCLTTFKKTRWSNRVLKRFKTRPVMLITKNKFYYNCYNSGISLSSQLGKAGLKCTSYSQPLFEKNLYLVVLLMLINHNFTKYYRKVLSTKSVKDSVNQQVFKFVYTITTNNCFLYKMHVNLNTFFLQPRGIFINRIPTHYTNNLKVNNSFSLSANVSSILALKTLSLLKLFIRVLNLFLKQKITGLNWNSQLNFLKASNYFFSAKDVKGYKNILFSPHVSHHFSTKLLTSNQVSKNLLKWRVINGNTNIIKIKKVSSVITMLTELYKFFKVGSLTKFRKLKYRVSRYVNKKRLIRLFSKIKLFLRKKKLKKSTNNKYKLLKKRFSISFWNNAIYAFDSSLLYGKDSKLRCNYIPNNFFSKHKNLCGLALSKPISFSKNNFAPFFKKFILLNTYTTQNYKFFWKLFYFFNYHNISRGLTKCLETNILPNFSSFRLNFSKLFFSSKFSSFFRENATPWVYNTLTRFIEHYSGKKSLIQVYSFMNQSINEHYSAFYKLWLPRFSYYERRLGHRFFLEEAFHILHMSFNLQDSKMLSTWLKAIIQRISFWKTRFIFRFLRYLFNNYFRFMFNELGAKGFKVKLKGKISVAGNSRKRSILYRVGKTSHATCNLKVLHKFDTIVTFTGVMGFQIWIFY